MSALDNKQLLNLMRYAPVAVVFVFALAVNLIAIQDNREQAAQSIETLREELTFQRKESIRSQVHEVYSHLLVEKYKAESNLKDAAKQRVYEAYGIANHIYAQNVGKSKAEISKIIIEALRSVWIFNGRGSFYIIDSEGETIMNAANTHSEEINDWVLQSEETDVIRNALSINQKNGEGFLRWKIKKPGSADDKEFEKIGYVKKFEHYDWSIVIADYLVDYEEDVKNELLKWFSQYKYGESGYFFVLDENGVLLAHHINDFLGLDFVLGEKINIDLIKDIKDKIKDGGGGYIRYSKPLTLSGMVILDQVGYVKEVGEWGWIIGTGFSSQAFEKNLRLKEEQLNELNYQNLMRLVYLTIASMILLTLSSLYVGNLIARRFEMFQSKINADFDELNNTKDKMEYMALHDALTGLPNRILMLKEIKENINLIKGENEKLAVMFVDLDNFKNINDLYGHYVGDLLLIAVSQRFKVLMRGRDSVSRFGGDEFVFCFPQLKDRKAAQDKAEEVRNALSSPIVIEGRTLTIACSIGVSICPDDSLTAETLIKNADTVLYKSKADKKGQYLFYNNLISVQIMRKMEIQHELARALERGELSVHYQPQMSMREEKLVGVEALARWFHPSLGNVFPDEFISVAEESGMIHDLDLFVFRRACEDLYALSSNGEGALKLSVNISPVQLTEPEFFCDLVDICTSVGIAPERITLEITENVFIHGFDIVKPLFAKLRQQGFGLSLDDFGTGYSSLSYINSLPLTEIKIDRSFINKFLDFYQSDMLVRMIVGIGRLCGLVVVAEGVETKSQLDKLLNYDCDLVQGYYFDRPLTIEQLSEKVELCKE
ncbi:bifunctional diguanylate cyclase/phosphodiesterase [Amphritea pacifica]|uniref:EAL domain-containing protein n=1 Tax=Amphritea pacifica TaxID=2811233 RepID=A0ABS2W9F1_9GAMM|nr:EAL domain-containing protein [Amphritea pacifica]MBN0988206.1 EAL domain-containing protein [Amphritea pacifica]